MKDPEDRTTLKGLICEVCSTKFEAIRFRKSCTPKCENHRKWLIVKAKADALKNTIEKTVEFPLELIAFTNERNKRKFLITKVEPDTQAIRTHILS